MARFREFLQQQDGMAEEREDIRRTLAKLPASHANLVRGFSWKFHAGNTLNGDSKHVGYMDDQDKEIAVAAPWNYGREFTLLHEIGHRVWERLPPDLQKQWHYIVANTKNKQEQEPEELFCMAYANHYVKNRVVIHDHPEWHRFIEGLPK